MLDGQGNLAWYGGVYNERSTSVQAFGLDEFASNNDQFFATDFTSQLADGTSSGYSQVSYYLSDNNSGEHLVAGLAYSGVSISDTTAVPTPALLPGLIGMGVGVLRRRKQAKAEAVAV